MNGAAFISGAGTLEAAQGLTRRRNLHIHGLGGNVRIDGTVMPQGTIYQFGPTNTIDLPDIPGGASGYTVLGPGNLLEIVENVKNFTTASGSSTNLRRRVRRRFFSECRHAGYWNRCHFRARLHDELRGERTATCE